MEGVETGEYHGSEVCFIELLMADKRKIMQIIDYSETCKEYREAE